jgi:hypothetical protein
MFKFILELTSKPTSEAFHGVQAASSDKDVVAKMEFMRSCATEKSGRQINFSALMKSVIS